MEMRKRERSDGVLEMRERDQKSIPIIFGDFGISKIRTQKNCSKIWNIRIGIGRKSEGAIPMANPRTNRLK